MIKLKYLSIFLLLLFFNASFAQEDLDAQLAKADQLYDNKQYDQSFELFSNLKGKFKKGSKAYNITADRICLIYFKKKRDLWNEKKYNESIEYLKEALNFIEQEKKYLNESWTKQNRYYFLSEIVLNYFSLEDYASAKQYQFHLYQMYFKNELPEEFKDAYLLDQFVYDGKFVLGFEYFAKSDDPKNEPGFAKVVYQVAELDESGNPGKFLFDLQVIKVHKNPNAKRDLPDYMLSKGIVNSKELGGALHEFTYGRIIDYAKLKKDIIRVLDGDYKKMMRP